MRKFKPLKELVRALTYIGDAIESENSKGDSTVNDDTNYVVIIGNGHFGIANKNLDSTKLAFNVNELTNSFKPKKVGDIFTQEGVDIINNMLSNNIIKTNTIKVFVFVKDTAEGDLLYSPVSLGFANNTNEYKIMYSANNIIGFTNDKFTLDTPLLNNGVQ